MPARRRRPKPRGRRIWTFTGSTDRITTHTLTDVDGGSGRRDDARAVNRVTNADLLLAGPLADLPAGVLTASMRSGGDISDFSRRSTVRCVTRPADLSRDRTSLRANLPITLRGKVGPRGPRSA